MSKTLTKSDIVEKICESNQINKTLAKELVETILKLMHAGLKKDNNILLSGFGKFECYGKKIRKGRNPQTAETMMLPPRKVIVFRISRKFRTELNV